MMLTAPKPSEVRATLNFARLIPNPPKRLVTVMLQILPVASRQSRAGTTCSARDRGRTNNNSNNEKATADCVAGAHISLEAERGHFKEDNNLQRAPFQVPC